MKECKHYINNMSAYIDNELDETFKSDFENHLNICKNCQEEFNKILLISDSLKENKTEIPDGFMSSLKAKIAQNETVTNDKKSIFTYVNFRTASLVLALAILLISFKSPVYKEFAGDKKYTGIENNVSKKKDENIEAKFVVLDKSEPEKENKSIIENKTFGTVETEITKKSDNAKYAEAKIAQKSSVVEFQIADTSDENVLNDTSTKASEQITLAAKSAGGGGSSSSATANTNCVKITLTKCDECFNIIEKYFGDANAISQNLSYENYISFKNEISAFCINIDEIIEDKLKTVNIEIFLS